MRVAAIICEFNPFHNGHKYLIDKVKREYADCVVAIMSGNFVQRGDVAITDKYSRAETALKNGCDLVVELPTVYAVSHAELFAKGSVEIAKALNTDILCFGAENDNINSLKDIADAFENESFIEAIREQMNNGDPYAKAVSITVEKTLSPEHATLLRGANNTLGIEYIKALRGSNISPVAIKRKDVDHNSTAHSENIASASFIRECILNGSDYSLFTDMFIDNPATIKNIESAIMYKLKTMSKEELSNIPNANEGLYNRIFEYAKRNNYLDELLDELKTHRYTYARLRRLIICALIGINVDVTKKAESGPKYLRVLAMNDIGSKLLKNSALPIVAKVKQDYEKLSEQAKEIFDIDVRAGYIYSLSRNDNTDTTNDFNAQIIKL